MHAAISVNALESHFAHTHICICIDINVSNNILSGFSPQIADGYFLNCRGFRTLNLGGQVIE